MVFSLQLVIMAGTVLLAYYFECTDIFSIHIQGFFCNDAELMKPYPGVEENSFIPPLILYCVVAAAPTAIVSKTLTSAWISFFYSLCGKLEFVLKVGEKKKKTGIQNPSEINTSGGVSERFFGNVWATGLHHKRAPSDQDLQMEV